MARLRGLTCRSEHVPRSKLMSARGPEASRTIFSVTPQRRRHRTRGEAAVTRRQRESPSMNWSGAR